MPDFGFVTNYLLYTTAVT